MMQLNAAQVQGTASAGSCACAGNARHEQISLVSGWTLLQVVQGL